MNDTTIKTLDHVRQFLNKLGALEFCIKAKDAHIAGLRPCSSDSATPSKSEKGLLLDFLPKGGGYSRIQVKRLIQQSCHTGQFHRRQRTVQGLRRLYTLDDIRLLAQTDELHGTPSGTATKKLSERAWGAFGQPEYQRVVGISVSYLHVFVVVQ